MYILLVSSWFPSEQDPTFGSFVFEQAALLLSRGHRVEVLQPVLSGTAKDTWTRKPLQKQTKVYNGLTVHFVPVNVRVPKIKALYYRLLLSRCIRVLGKHFIQTGKPDILHSHAAFAGGIIAGGMARHFGIPLVHTEHTSGFIFRPQQYDAADRKMLQKLGRVADRTFFVSRFAQKMSEEKMGISFGHTAVLPNLVHASFFAAPDAGPKAYDALCIGDFSTLKNQSFLLDVWRLVLQEWPSARLALAGKGFDSPGFLEKKNRLDPDGSNLVLLPRLSRQEVRETIGRSRMVLSASRVETFGLTLAEALAGGTPVVATDSGGPRDIVLPGDGFLIAQNDPVAFAEAISELMKGRHDPPEQISERCKRRFGEEQIYSRLEEAYRSVLS